METNNQPEALNYQRLELLDHVLLRPGMYIGSTQPTERDSWLYDFETGRAYETTITLPQGCERTFLEIISNAGDNVLRSLDEGLDPGSIDVRMDNYEVTVRNGGKPIPLEIHPKEQLWIPDLIFGTLLTSSNYDDTKKRVGCGLNGLGAKLTSAFSQEFSVEVGDSKRGLHYFQRWQHNMRTRYQPVITTGYSGESFVEVKYRLDFPRFGLTNEAGYPEEAFGLYARCVYDYSQNLHVKTSFNQLTFEPTKDPKDHGKFYFGEVPMILHYEWPEGTEVITKKNGLQRPKDPTILPTATLILADTPTKGKSVSFVNGIFTSEGGVHVNEALKAVSKPLLDSINRSRKTKTKVTDKDEKKIKLTWKDVKGHLSILLVCHLFNPDFGGQMKEKLTKPTPKFNIPEKTLAPINKWQMVTYLLAIMEDKIGKLLTTTDGKKKKFISSEKGFDANLAGSHQSLACSLFVVEGDSAKNYAYIAQGLIDRGTDYIGILPLRGKPINAMNAEPLKIKNNKEIEELKRFLGIREFTDYLDDRNFRQLRYGKLVILADADDDGKHIMGLILLLFHCYYPSLLQRGFVSFLRTPIIRIQGRQQVLNFYTQAEFNLWKSQHPDYATYGHPKYYKGLGTSNPKDVEEDFKDPHFVNYRYEGKDETTKDSQALNLVFDKKRADDRKVWLRNWHYELEELNIGRLEEISVYDFIEKEFVMYCQTNIRRSIPSLMDGLKNCQRKILWAAYQLWGDNKANKPSKRVSSFAAYIIENLEYHHGESSLASAIISMAQDFVGSNNMNYLSQDGMFGSRMEGGKDAAAPRYPFTRLEWWFPYIYKKDDMAILTARSGEDGLIEPYFFLPILPMQIINGSHGVGTSVSTHIPNHHPLDVVKWYRARLQGQPTPTISPWYRGFTGEIKVVLRKNQISRQDELLPDEIEQLDENEATEEIPKYSLVTRGCFYHQNNLLVITELPIGLWTLTYKQWLEKLILEKKIKGFSSYCDTQKVHFTVNGFRDADYKTLKLQRSYGLTNMVLLDRNDRPVKYPTIKSILEAFYQERLPYFQKRKEYVLRKYQEAIDKLDAKARFIQAVKDGLIDLNADHQTIERKLQELKIPNWVRDMKTRSLAKQSTDKIYQKIEATRQEMQNYQQKTPEKLWLEDLDEFEAAYSRHKEKKVKVTTKKYRL